MHMVLFFVCFPGEFSNRLLVQREEVTSLSYTDPCYNIYWTYPYNVLPASLGSKEGLAWHNAWHIGALM